MSMHVCLVLGAISCPGPFLYSSVCFLPTMLLLSPLHIFLALTDRQTPQKSFEVVYLFIVLFF